MLFRSPDSQPSIRHDAAFCSRNRFGFHHSPRTHIRILDMSQHEAQTHPTIRHMSDMCHIPQCLHLFQSSSCTSGKILSWHHPHLFLSAREPNRKIVFPTLIWSPLRNRCCRTGFPFRRTIALLRAVNRNSPPMPLIAACLGATVGSLKRYISALGELPITVGFR